MACQLGDTREHEAGKTLLLGEWIVCIVGGLKVVQ